MFIYFFLYLYIETIKHFIFMKTNTLKLHNFYLGIDLLTKYIPENDSYGLYPDLDNRVYFGFDEWIKNDEHKQLLFELGWKLDNDEFYFTLNS